MQGTSVAFDPLGNVVATGTFTGTIDMGTGPFVSHGGTDVYLVKLAGSAWSRGPGAEGGRTMWSKAFGDVYDDYATAVAVDPFGAIVTLGQYTGTVDLGTGPVSANGARFFGSSDVFVARYDAAGRASWVRNIGAPDRVDWADALAIDSGGGAYVAMRSYNAVAVGGCVAWPTLDEGVHGQAFVAQLTPSGSPVCIRRYGDGLWSQVRSMVVHPVKGLILTGVLEGPMELEQGTITTTDGSGGFVAHETTFPAPPTW